MTVKKIMQGRPFGHPLHPLTVHLPLGLWLMGLILDIVSETSADGAWAVRGAFACLAIGSGMALISAVTGLVDWFDIREDHPAQTTALWHMSMMIPATLLFCVDAIVHYGRMGEAKVGFVGMSLSIVAYALSLIGGYLGGRLVYDDGIGVGRHRRRTELPQFTMKIIPAAAAQELADRAAVDGWHRLIPESELAEGDTFRADVEGTVMTLARSNGRVFAVQEFCTHRCGPLSAGEVRDGEIVCPWHHSQFDLSTGKVVQGPAKVDLKTFPVVVREGIIFVSTEKSPGSPINDLPERTVERRNPAEEMTPRSEVREPLPRRAPTE